MKKIFLVIAVSIGALTSVKAQLTKGNLFLGTDIGTGTYNSGNYSFNYSDGNVVNQNFKKSTISLSPQIGVFLTDHLIFGGHFDLNYDHEKSIINNTDPTLAPSQSTTDGTTYTIGPFLRYYFFNSTPSKTLVFLQGSAGIGSGSSSENQTETVAGTNNVYTANSSGMFTYNVGGSLGITHFVSKNVGLDIAVSYLYNNEKYTNNFNNANSGGSANNTGSYKASLPNNGIGIFAGFHLFLP